MTTSTRSAKSPQRFALELRGDAARAHHGVATLAAAGAGQLGFLANPRYRAQLADSRAGAVVLRAEDAEACAGACLIADDPYVAFARIAALFEHRAGARTPGVHASAVVGAGARVAPRASIGPLCVDRRGAIVDDGAVLGPHCIVGEDCVVGAQSRLVARVTLVHARHAGPARAGPSGRGARRRRLRPRVRRDAAAGSRCRSSAACVVGDDCEIGANTTIDRGALDDTVLEEDVRLDNQIQIAHNVRIGAHTAMAGCVGGRRQRDASAATA